MSLSPSRLAIIHHLAYSKLMTMSKERLLSESELEEDPLKDFRAPKYWSQLSRVNILLWVALLCLSASNVILYLQGLGEGPFKDARPSKYCMRL